MSANIEYIRRTIAAEGFVAPLDDIAAVQMAYGLRLAPAVCLAWTATGTFLAAPTILWALIPFAALGAILPNHPFDVIYNFGLRHLIGAAPLPHYPITRRIVCMIATVMLLITAWGFYTGLPIVGYTIGGLMIASALLYSTSGLCVISFLLQPRNYLRHLTH